MITGVLMLMLILSITACQKEPVQGPKGDPGNANVHSITYTVPTSGWSVNGNVLYATIPVSEITSDIITSGAVLVYLETQPGAFGQLPVTTYPADWYSETFEVYTAAGAVEIHISDSDLTQPPTPANALKFKIVVIAGSGLAANPVNTLTTYAKVKQTFNLKD